MTRHAALAAALVAALVVLFGRDVRAQQPGAPDSTKGTPAKRDSVYQLPTITVTRTEEPLSRAPVAADVLDRRTIQRGQPTLGLDESLNNIPGVYVANRYNFSLDQRLSIRGFGSRANFGLRGVKVLLDGVPQTLPDGQSQLTNVDFGAVDRIEVLRGASSSLYGNASGGVIALRSERAGPEPFTQRVRAEYGAFGTDKWQSFTTARADKWSGTLSVSRFTTTGFRLQSAAESRQLAFGVDYLASGTTSFALRLLAADAPRAQNPGALTLAEYAINRDSATANSILRHADKDVQQQQLALTARHFDKRGNEYSAVVFGLLRDLENPTATGPAGPPSPLGTFIKIDRNAGGVRLATTQHLATDARAPRLTGGIDVQRLRDHRFNWRSISGAQSDTLLLDQLETVTEFGPFVQAVWTPNTRLLLSAAVRYDWVKFGVDDQFLTDGDNSGGRTFSSASGNVGASYVVSERFTPYANVATAFETPTTTELANRPDGSGGFNDVLDPQHAVTFELGARGQFGRWVTYSVAGFVGRVRDAIVQYRNVDNRSFFTNAGRLRNDGLEFGLSVSPIPELRAFGSYTYAKYRYGDYQVQNGATTDDFEGNRLPGVPRHFTRIGVRTDPLPGLALDIDHTISSSVQADDANRITIPGWHAGVTNARISWQGNFARTSVTPFFGVNNLWNRAYIGSVTINGALGRVVEPAPRRNVYVGAEIGYRGGR